MQIILKGYFPGSKRIEKSETKVIIRTISFVIIPCIPLIFCNISLKTFLIDPKHQKQYGKRIDLFKTKRIVSPFLSKSILTISVIGSTTRDFWLHDRADKRLVQYLRRYRHFTAIASPPPSEWDTFYLAFQARWPSRSRSENENTGTENIIWAVAICRSLKYIRLFWYR